MPLFLKLYGDPNRAIFMDNMGPRTTVTEMAILVNGDTTLGNAETALTVSRY
jgi:hypothetical protein